MEGTNKSLQQEINRYIKEHARRNNITVEEAKQKEIVKNVIEWIKIRWEDKRKNGRKRKA